MNHDAPEFDNEFQAAYAVSQIERSQRPADDKAKIEALRQAGRFVVYLSLEVTCRHTDALLGEDRHFVADFSSREEAEAACSCEDHCIAAPFETVVAAPVETETDEIPF